MKKKLKATWIKTCMMVLLSAMSYGRQVEDSAGSAKYEYCELVGRQKFLSTKVVVSVDYGNPRGFFKDTRVRDEVSGKVQAFNSMIDALNYLGENGWEFVQAYTLTNQEQNVYRWLLKRRK